MGRTRLADKHCVRLHDVCLRRQGLGDHGRQDAVGSEVRVAEGDHDAVVGEVVARYLLAVPLSLAAPRAMDPSDPATEPAASVPLPDAMSQPDEPLAKRVCLDWSWITSASQARLCGLGHIPIADGWFVHTDPGHTWTVAQCEQLTSYLGVEPLTTPQRADPLISILVLGVPELESKLSTSTGPLLGRCP